MSTPKKKKSSSKSKSIQKKKPVLVIVESPTKTRSLSKFLGKEYRIESSKGHLIDLPKSSMGISIEDNFEPHYITIRGKGKTLSELKKAAKSADHILLATDPDREGEAISWHLSRALSTVNSSISRVEFNEITKEAVVAAVSNPRKIDEKMVNSQQARRILDRLVGYSISPILQEKFGSRRFSAGRVQSAALKILCEREDEIDKFIPVEYWEIEATFQAEKAKDRTTVFRLSAVDGKKPEIHSAAEADALEKIAHSVPAIVSQRKTSERRVKPPAPYITSRLQQEASTRLGFRAQKTMSVAQSLYEGVELGDGNLTGLITYMRTDSTRISEAGLQGARDFIGANYSQEYLPEQANIYTKNQKAAQDAHECIRPTDPARSPESIEKFLSKDQFKLYSLIWRRFIASQMNPGIDELVTLELECAGEKTLQFRFSSGRQKFPGFRAVFPTGEDKNLYVPAFHEGEEKKLQELNKLQKFTQPPARYTEASLIKVMEESGIGRPATYVPTMGTLDKRSYIERKGRQLIPTMLGRVVNTMLVKHFPEIVNLEFTAGMEAQLDSVADGGVEWRQMLHDFYGPFAKDLVKAGETMESQSHLIRIPTGRDCPKCGNQLLKKLGKNGFFIGCSDFAGGCRYTESIPLGDCPLCTGKVVKKKTKKGRNFFGCDQYSISGCEFTMLETPAKKTCPRCNSIMGQKVRKTGITLTCQNVECKYVMEEASEDNAGESNSDNNGAAS
ncbi:MAG: type I DNA topoisomerase [Leptospiraceae bacterium]|nr:type I DNA topoisomerase [Leptospiraceae bacterium]